MQDRSARNEMTTVGMWEKHTDLFCFMVKKADK